MSFSYVVCLAVVSRTRHCGQDVAYHDDSMVEWFQLCQSDICPQGDVANEPTLLALGQSGELVDTVLCVCVCVCVRVRE